MGRMSWTEAMRRLEAFDIDAAAGMAIEKDADELADMNRDQLLHGLNSSGKKMARYKNAAYATKKYAMNTLAGRGIRDQKLTGRFYAGLHVYSAGKGRARFTSSDPKTADIVYRDGKWVFGLTPENLSRYRAGTLRPGIIRRLNAAIKLQSLAAA